jgi:prepilin signal peptidase PulO-like enzyme (type II secretory pathway)
METAIVGVIGAFIGILLSNLATVLLEIRRRRERIKDVQTSLRAEIRSHWHRLAPPIELDDRAEIIVSRIREASERGLDFTPFIPREDPAVVFGSVAGEIHILPNDVIDPIVLY